MKEIKVKVHTMEGDEREIETPLGLKVDEFVKELAIVLRLTLTDSEARPIIWRLDDKDTGRTLDPGHTLDENGVREGHRLSLIRATLAGGPGPDAIDTHLKAFQEGLKSFYDLFKTYNDNQHRIDYSNHYVSRETLRESCLEGACDGQLCFSDSFNSRLLDDNVLSFAGDCSPRTDTETSAAVFRRHNDRNDIEFSAWYYLSRNLCRKEPV